MHKGRAVGIRAPGQRGRLGEVDLRPAWGQVIDVGLSFGSDGSCRPVRGLAGGSSTWKQLYQCARNGCESGNATFQRWGLKRPSVYGEPRGKAFLFPADLWFNLITLARLFREATAAAGPETAPTAP